MSTVSTSSLSESSDFVEYSQAQASTVSSGEHAEIKKKVYMRKKDRKASFNQSNLAGVDDNKGNCIHVFKKNYENFKSIEKFHTQSVSCKLFYSLEIVL